MHEHKKENVMKYIGKLFIATLLAVVAFACTDTNENATGKASISITDAPIDDANVKAVFISINSVEVKGPDGWKTLDAFEEPIKIDLLSYQNGEAYFLTEETLEAAAYNEVRLMLDIQEKTNGSQQNAGCYIEYKDGTTQPLFVPSGGQSGYKAKGDFVIPAGGTVALTLDFDVRKAIVKAGNSGKFILKPTVRLIANNNAGLINGSFNAEDSTFNKVVVFAYANDEFDMSETDEPADEEVRFENAITSSVVADDDTFTLAFMNAGTYDLYFANFDEEGNYVGLIGSYEDVEVGPGAIIELDLSLSLLD